MKIITSTTRPLKATPHKACAEDAPTDFFVRLYRNSAGILSYVKGFLCKMTENMSADSVQSRQAGFARCCLNNIHYICMHIGGSPVTCYVINGRNGDLLIDTGFYFCCDRLREWLGQFNIRHILLTHAHVDHDYNAAKLRKLTGAQILLSENDVSLIGNYRSQPVKATMKKYRLRNIQQNVCGGMKLFSTRPYSPDIIIKNQDSGILRSLGYDADIIPLPGHTLGSLGVLADNVLYCGDAFTAMWGRPDITPHATSLKAMRRSLKRILKISPKWLATGHGLPVSMDKARPVIIKYLKERSRI